MSGILSKLLIVCTSYSFVVLFLIYSLQQSSLVDGGEELRPKNGVENCNLPWWLNGLGPLESTIGVHWGPMGSIDWILTKLFSTFVKFYSVVNIVQST